MVIGRAVNGWKYNLNLEDEQSIKQCTIDIVTGLEKDNLGWVEKLWGYSGKNEKSIYNTKRSAFWRLVEGIVGLQNSAEANQFFTDSIVWSNLYKVAKFKDDDKSKGGAKGGNPSPRLCKIEFELCQKILDAEINTYDPTTIVFLTGVDWASPFLEEAVGISNLSTNTYVKQVGVYRGKKYMVGPHPQGKSKYLYVEEIAECLK